MSKNLILLDSDVIIHLFKADKLSLLNQLFPGQLRVLDIVLSELNNNPTIKNCIDNFFTLKQMEEITFPAALYSEFFKQKNLNMGRGERASLIYCKHNNNIIASSNFKDVHPYCVENSVKFLTTLDFLCIAIDRVLITPAEANQIIQKIINNKSNLVCHDINTYLKSFFNKEKLKY